MTRRHARALALTILSLVVGVVAVTVIITHALHTEPAATTTTIEEHP